MRAQTPEDAFPLSLPRGEEDVAAALDARGFALLMDRLGPFETAPRLAVAVSGGADSLALMLLASEWAARRGGTAIGLTVDHRLRTGSGAEARRVGRWLAARGIRHHVLAWRGPHPESGIQALAREARYALLAEWCAARHILHLLTAHHRDDQAETLLLRLARGSGVDGLAGMAPASESATVPPVGDAPPRGPRLLRPLLGVPKATLEATLLAAGQGWIEDPSNASPRFARVRMRAALPMLAAEGLTAERLAATASRLGRARAALDDSLAELAVRAVSLAPEGFVRIALPPYRAAPQEIALRCLSHCLMTVGGGGYTPRLERLERLHALLAGGAGPAVRTLAGCRIEVGPAAASICREAAAAAPDISAAAGQAVWWDGRFRIVLAGVGRARIGRLGPDGWREALAVRPDLRGCRLPAAVRAGLPALRDRAGLLEVPHLGYRRADRRGPRVQSLDFAPRHPLAGHRFMVV